MKRYFILSVFLLAGAVAIVFVQSKHDSATPSPEALLLATADAQHELTRIPTALSHMSDADEIELGKDIALGISSKLEINHQASPDDAVMQRYLQSVGERVAAHTRRKLPWTFHYIPSPNFANAFALPGGQVYVGQGLIQLMDSEDALAAVLGHEIEHIDLLHCQERAQMNARIRRLDVFGDVANLPIQLFMAGYKKEEEIEADRDGTTLAVQAGYSYVGILQLFDRFGSLEANSAKHNRSVGPLSEAIDLSVATLSDYLMSHPSGQQRSEQVRKLALERDWPSRSLQPLTIHKRY